MKKDSTLLVMQKLLCDNRSVDILCDAIYTFIYIRKRGDNSG